MQTQTTTPTPAKTGNRQWINANPLAIDHPNDRRFLIKQNKALVLWGEQGSGKTTFAQNVAKADGTFAVVNWQVFQYVGGTYQYICENESTLIVEDTPTDKKTWATIKALATQKTLTINSKNQPPRQVPMPRLIFICNEKPPIPEDSRHFKVIALRTTKPLPLWYRYFCTQLVEIRELKDEESIRYHYTRLSGFVAGLYIADVINNDERDVLDDIRDNASQYAIADSKQKELCHAPV